MKLVPGTGSPPMPTHVVTPMPFSFSSLSAWYVSVPERLTMPTGPPGQRDLGRDEADVALADREHARAVRAEDARRREVSRDRVVEARFVVHRDAFGDDDDELEPGFGRFDHRVGGEAGGHDHHRRGRAGLLHRFGDRREHRDAFDVGAGLLGCDPADDLRAVLAVAQPVEAALAAGEPLHDHLRVGVDENAHFVPPASATALRAASTIVG